MKTAILISLGISAFFFALSWWIEEKSQSADDSMGASLVAMPGLISGVVFLALCAFALVRMVWWSL